MNVFIRRALTILSLGLLILSPLSVANAATDRVTVENLRGPLINAFFSSLDPSGCIETDTFVTANRPTDQLLPGRGTTTGIGAVSIFEYNSCTDTSVLQAVGQTDTLAAADFQVSRQLDWASLHTTITVTNIDTGDDFDVSVNIALVGTGDIHRDHDNTNDRYGGGCHVLNRWKGAGRDADASGSVSDGVTNFTPTTSQWGEIGVVIDGFEVIDCP
ncbi:MAG: hypothetical protein M3O94_02765 [Actinomycetota bacterium]|nr:hypothetical protein [Actinomycetota bacterium]